MPRKLAIAALCLMLAGLQYRLWWGDGNIFSTRELRAAVNQQSQENTSLRETNAVLIAEVKELHDGGAAIEARARSELGMIRRGETFYLVVEPEGEPAGSQTSIQ